MKKAQRILDYFLNLESKRRQFFFINWTVPNASASWLHQMKDKKAISFKAVVKWKDIGDIVISCFDNPNGSLYKSPITEEGKENNQFLLSFLKSHLQKSIRRQKLSAALSTSLQLIAINPNEFIRRLCIIMFEDVRLQSYFSNIIWLTSAVSKGYQITTNQINLLLSYVALLVNDNETLSLPLEATKQQKALNHYLDLVEKNKAIDDKQKDILYCILFRISYGGMECDMEMLMANFIYYHQQFTEGFALEEKHVQQVDYNKIPLLMVKSDYVIEAIDFHCFPFIINNIKKDIGENKYSTEELKECIWEYNSKTNTRCIHDNKDNDARLEFIWNGIASSLRKNQYTILNTSILNQTNKVFITD